ncbi:epsilon-sarcoglycan-like [Lethenteron reissneri]|uniref:epsilon-sarcoglycan-like n=1 Tax=Lethenteron reissneri TaxID=7753 RepID=UPI002AB7DC20|nr:epsilon-sarcoglycan-like [Lethenteron reissneri]XP_061429696.1 epsilon-sarcoglycan-like [Lethenteron reissneri]XP_061429706.1 epsilon-sarcoglycan-like [Lethenteron reissneri]XP_061429714.1 epsilon-sarcoglycan-like [Lethenteron reissneri]XP_061429723.1 epsilon-sarcoglycan-like [Lethenteron reissneri]
MAGFPLLTAALATVLLVACSLPSGAAGDQNVYLSPDTLFVHFLNREYFAEFFQGRRDDPMTFNLNLEGHPDLPGWLRYLQRSPYENGLLYGTASARHEGKSVIQVVACNRRTFQVVKQRLILHIHAVPDNEVPFRFELFLSNVDVDDLLRPDVRASFEELARTAWGAQPPPQAFRLVNVTSALERGGRVPLPIRGLKEGVYVQVGADAASPRLLDAVRRAASSCDQRHAPAPPTHSIFYPRFRSDWCRLRLLNASGPPEAGDEAPGGSGVLDAWGPAWAPPPSDLPPRDFSAAYALAVALPLVLAVLFIAVLTYVMCCRREGLEKRDTATPEMQLVHHRSIRETVRELRDLALRRDVRPLSTLPMFNPRGGGALPSRGPDGDTGTTRLIGAEQTPPSERPSRPPPYQGRPHARQETSFTDSPRS